MSAMVKTNVLRTNKISESLSPGDRESVYCNSNEVALVCDTVLNGAGSRLDHVYFPHQGLISSLVVMANASVAEAGFVGPEGAVGTSYDAIPRTSYTRDIVIAAGRALRVPIQDFESVLDRSPAFRTLIVQNNNRKVERGQQLAACNLLHQLELRVCRWLLQVVDSSPALSVAITQDGLAQMLGVSRARLNETLKSLQNADAISQTQRGVVTIVNADVIAERVCDCYRLMRVPTPD